MIPPELRKPYGASDGTTPSPMPLSRPPPGLGTSSPVVAADPKAPRGRGRRIVVGAVLNDPASVSILIAFKVVRLMVLWVALYFVDRAFQSAYLEKVMVEDKPPPALWTAMPFALAIEGVAIGLVLLLVTLLKARFKRDGNAFVFDGPLLGLLMSDYIRTTVPILALGSALGAVTQHSKYLRYKEDGLRAIRAHCTALLLVSAVVLVLPLGETF